VLFSWRMTQPCGRNGHFKMRNMKPGLNALHYIT
jgi:hypothetical protein